MDGECCFPFPRCAIRLPPKLSMKVSVHNADWSDGCRKGQGYLIMAVVIYQPNHISSSF